MAQQEFELVAIEYNNKSEPINVFKVKTLKKEMVKEINAQVLKEKAKCVELANAKKLELEKKEQVENEKRLNMARIIAYLMYDEFVERGLYEMPQDFETMFNGFLSGKEFNNEFAPKEYLAILERMI